MKELPALTGSAKQYEEFLHNPDALAEYAEVVIAADAFAKIFRRHARVMHDFWVSRGIQPPRSTEAVYRKYSDAYLTHLYYDERLNQPGDIMTWHGLARYLDTWERDQYMQMTDYTDAAEVTPTERK